jgi:hypothetical protein
MITISDGRSPSLKVMIIILINKNIYILMDTIRNGRVFTNPLQEYIYPLGGVFLRMLVF